jgi:hypothetical protein
MYTDSPLDVAFCTGLADAIDKVRIKNKIKDANVNIIEFNFLSASS